MVVASVRNKEGVKVMFIRKSIYDVTIALHKLRVATLQQQIDILAKAFQSDTSILCDIMVVIMRKRLITHDDINKLLNSVDTKKDGIREQALNICSGLKLTTDKLAIPEKGTQRSIKNLSDNITINSNNKRKQNNYQDYNNANSKKLCDCSSDVLNNIGCVKANHI